MSCCVAPPDPTAAEEIGRRVALRLTAFLRLLRQHGFTVGQREGADALRLAATPLGRRPSLLQGALKALLCTRLADWRRFDELFQAHWLGRGMKAALRVAGAGGKPRTLRELAAESAAPAERSSLAELGAGGEDRRDDEGAPGTREGASQRESLERSDFRKLADAEAQAEARALAERLARRMRSRLTRRHRSARRGRRLDLRRTIRRNVAHGGLPIELVRRRPRQRPLRLVVLLDASGSMQAYTAVFLRFVQGLLDSFREAEAFLFHTRLMHVSDALKDRDAGRALERLSLMVQGIGGGTRIGESLEDFNRHHARRVLHGRSCVLILSDGYDAGPPERLDRAMAALRRRCRRIVWLNPMMGWQGYEPSARGMQAALPYVDLFAPAHSLESLAALEPYLARL
jgi:uncharacterized protein with von Willebrand factor type A (vWA) domain